mmetsp:Transcript_4171/g.5373  ORF Transcript_4171/g.5373 Transcript_4171/m.5373 type:complete len:454 (-) Transcript_4171:527-1888(-)|eukprot:CAMPEP_0117755936 /NCGR_PEP_ID=MMETSP0947-20121206/13754_1 /TAXON_ID=44440 /ORGANISM="Chattonella subsalsa, Strain CCMP2191" /LENGTH=453 /DNA_ID=CAMNT_0005575377 /DNA_START=210 /DNA_END=1571 /DNA_ORIENTATION=+
MDFGYSFMPTGITDREEINSKVIRQLADTEIARMYGNKAAQKFEALKLSRDAQLHQIARSVPSLIVKKRNVMFPTIHPTQVEDNSKEEYFVWGEALLWNMVNSIEFDAPCRGMDAKKFLSLIIQVAKRFFGHTVALFSGKQFNKPEVQKVNHDLAVTYSRLQRELDRKRLNERSKRNVLSLCADLIVLLHTSRLLKILHKLPLPTPENSHKENRVLHVEPEEQKERKICIPFILRNCPNGNTCKRKHICREVLAIKKCKLLASKGNCKYGTGCFYDHSFKSWKRKGAVSHSPMAPPAPDIDFSGILELDGPKHSVHTPLSLTPQPKRRVVLHPAPQYSNLYKSLFKPVEGFETEAVKEINKKYPDTNSLFYEFMECNYDLFLEVLDKCQRKFPSVDRMYYNGGFDIAFPYFIDKIGIGDDPRNVSEKLKYLEEFVNKAECMSEDCDWMHDDCP